MDKEVCVNIHALCFERRTRVLEVNFLIILHYGVWGHYTGDVVPPIRDVIDVFGHVKS